MAKNDKSSKKTGCERINYVNGDGEQKHFYSAWHYSKLGKVQCKITPMTPEGAKNLAELKGYSDDYTNISQSGHLRHFYELTFRPAGSLEVQRKKGICSLKNGRFLINSMQMIANVKKNSFTTL